MLLTGKNIDECICEINHMSIAPWSFQQRRHIIFIPEHDFRSVHPARWARTRFIGRQHGSWHEPRQRWACNTDTRIRCIVSTLCDALLPCSDVFCNMHHITSHCSEKNRTFNDHDVNIKHAHSHTHTHTHTPTTHIQFSLPFSKWSTVSWLPGFSSSAHSEEHLRGRDNCLPIWQHTMSKS